MPARLRALMIGLLLASLAWGAVTTWAVIQHASAAHDVVSASEPLSLSAQRLNESLSDADVTATTAFLASLNEPLADRQRYAADIAQAAADITSLKGAAATSANRQLLSSVAAVSAGLPVYTGYVAQAQTERSLGYLLTGGSFMQVASEEMHLTLLPAARAIYVQENAALAAASARATGLPWIVVAVVLAIVLGLVLFGVQRWLTRRTHRIVNYGLLAASLVLVASVVWLIVAFVVARSDLQRGVGHGSAPAELLAQAAIGTQQARGDEVLNLISRSGDTTFVQDFQAVRRKLGPGPGTLLTAAAAASPSGAGARVGRGRSAGRAGLVRRERPGVPPRRHGAVLPGDAAGDQDRAGHLGRRVQPRGERPQPGDRRGSGGLPLRRDRGQQRLRRPRRRDHRGRADHGGWAAPGGCPAGSRSTGEHRAQPGPGGGRRQRRCRGTRHHPGRTCSTWTAASASGCSPARR